jgi:hypothetical protein
MKRVNRSKTMLSLLGVFWIFLYVILLVHGVNASESEGMRPIADAGLPRYAATEPVQLDGSNSYDPDVSGPLTYTWTQVSGPPTVVIDANTPTPTILGFVQTEVIQEYEFELVISDGELKSRGDTTSVIVVPSFGNNIMRLENASFDPNKPTYIYFGGGNCTIGYSGQYVSSTDWINAGNIIDFPYGYEPDKGTGTRTYFHYADMIIVYLSSVAPNYRQPIQMAGWSTGGQPAIDVALRLNMVYMDARYAANRVTFLEAASSCRNYSENIQNFLASSVDGEQCWIDNYVGGSAAFFPNILNIAFSLSHSGVPEWYSNSLTGIDMNKSNNGIVAGAYWSVFRPGKNLQLASTPDAQTYKFRWNGGVSSGNMSFYNESLNPGRLQEPVTLVGPSDGATIGAEGAVLSCMDSQNAVRYQLLFGRDPFHMVYLSADTMSPPNEVVSMFPFEKTWWTIMAHDQYGSTIYADPICISTENVIPQVVENSNTGQTYSSIQQAINDALNGDEIVLDAGIWLYQENLDFKGKSLTLRSIDPNDKLVVATTVITGGHRAPVVTLSSGGNGPVVLDGLTIIGGTVGISCRDAVPTIRNCAIESNGPIAIEFWYGYEPIIIDCNIVGQVKDVNEPGYMAYWRLDEKEGTIALDIAAENNGTLHSNPLWLPEGGMIKGALEFDGIDDYISTPCVLNPAVGTFSVFAWVKGGLPGQVIVSQKNGANWLIIDQITGCLITELKGSGQSAVALVSPTSINDGNWHRIGLSWDGINRILYVDDVEVAGDTQPILASSTWGLYIGAGKGLESNSFWSGMIDDVRIYNRAVLP